MAMNVTKRTFLIHKKNRVGPYFLRGRGVARPEVVAAYARRKLRHPVAAFRASSPQCPTIVQYAPAFRGFLAMPRHPLRPLGMALFVKFTRSGLRRSRCGGRTAESNATYGQSNGRVKGKPR